MFRHPDVGLVTCLPQPDRPYECGPPGAAKVQMCRFLNHRTDSCQGIWH
jgi:hypothetical protein